MNNQKRFSFIIPTYQSKKLIKNTLQTLNFQRGYTGEDYEAVVIDDGSDDGTREYIKGINRNYELKYIYLDRSSESSRSRARNAGIKAACGEIIIFIDGDMLVKENYLQETDRCFKVREDIVVIGNRVMLDKEVPHEEVSKDRYYEGPEFKINTFKKLEMRHIVYSELSYNSSCHIYPWLQAFSCNMAIPKRLMEEYGYFDEQFKGWGLEDVELGYRLYKNGAKIIINNRTEAFHQYHWNMDRAKNNDGKNNDIERNTLYFIEKHPEALNVSKPVALKLFKGIALFRLNAVSGIRKRVRIDYREKGSLKEIKLQILSLCKNKHMNIVINDFVEDDNLDLWIQLLGEQKSIPRYFPASKKRELRSTMNAIVSLNIILGFIILNLKKAGLYLYFRAVKQLY